MGVSSINLKSFHNIHCDLKDFLGGNDLPKHLTEILIDENWEIKQIEIVDRVEEKIMDFQRNYLYRTEMTVGNVLESVL